LHFIGIHWHLAVMAGVNAVQYVLRSMYARESEEQSYWQWQVRQR
jgi:hypothetical protein